MKDMTWGEIIEFIQKNENLDEVAAIDVYDCCFDFKGTFWFDVNDNELIAKE